LHEYIAELTGDRNYIAHMHLVFAGPMDLADQGDQLMIPMLASALLEDDGRTPLSVDEVGELGLDFQQAAEYVGGLIVALAASSPGEFARPIARRRPPRHERQEAYPRRGTALGQPG